MDTSTLVDIKNIEFREEERITKKNKELIEYIAKEELEKSEFICQILGEHIVKNFCKAKKAEWEEYTNQVTQWELDQYLYRI